MSVLLDTCVLSEIQHPRGNPHVREAVQALEPEAVYLSVLTLGELNKGLYLLPHGAKRTTVEQWFNQLMVQYSSRILGVDTQTAALGGEIAAMSSLAGRTLPSIDALLAATALRHGMRLMTRNVEDLQPTGVMLINPWATRD